MKGIPIIVLAAGMVVSPIIHAQQVGQGSAVPRQSQSIVVAQAGTWTSPGSPGGPGPAALPQGFVPMMTIFGLGGLAIVASTDTSTNH
jgi:hypothetical protein